MLFPGDDEECEEEGSQQGDDDDLPEIQLGSTIHKQQKEKGKYNYSYSL